MPPTWTSCGSGMRSRRSPASPRRSRRGALRWTGGADPSSSSPRRSAMRDDPQRNPAKTKYPQGWLNDERYNDAAASDRRRRAKGTSTT